MKSQAPNQCDYLIVLGAKVNGSEPSPILKRRIEAAYEYLIKNQDTKVICSGGKGEGEEISEGESIAATLKDMGIEENRIIIETSSETTVQNMKLSLNKISGNPGAIAVVTNGFHIFRSKFILSRFTDAKVFGISSEGGGILMPHYMLRECIVFGVDLAVGNYSD